MQDPEKPVIVTIDIETGPQQGYFWGAKWETDIVQVLQHTQVLSYSAKWLGGRQITRGLPDYKGYKKGIVNDAALIKDVWNILNDVDIVVTQNGKDFDIRVLNARFVFHKLPPPSPYKVVDTKTEAKKYLKLPSNSLDDICDFLGIGRKKSHEGFSLWTRCMDGEASAWRAMKLYNANDVIITEKLYLRLLPWIQSHPNVGTFKDKLVCPKCGSGDLQARGYARNSTTKYQRVQCKSCGGWARVGKNLQIIKQAVSI